MATNIVPALDYPNRKQLLIWEAFRQYTTKDVLLYNDKLYKVLIDHTSTSVELDISSGNIKTLISKKVSLNYYDIGPFTAQAGYSGNIDTGAQYAELSTNEVVIGFRPTASGSDNGGQSDGGRVTVRFGFALRIARINRQ